MKVIIYYNDHTDKTLHKTLRITLPKSWRDGPTSKLINQFVETYNGNSELGTKNPLDPTLLHLAIRSSSSTTTPTTPSVDLDNKNHVGLIPLASDAIVKDVILDRQDLYIVHGSSQTLVEMKIEKDLQEQKRMELKKNTVQCIRFGCNKRFPKGGPYPVGPCIYHVSPPVFHETAKYWSCCPQKKVYDFDEFQCIPGCQTASCCTDVRDDISTNSTSNAAAPTVLGGMDLRDPNHTTTAIKLKSIDDFNKVQESGGSQSAPILNRLQNVFMELGIEKELYQQVLNGLRNEIIIANDSSSSSNNNNDEAAMMDAIKNKMGTILKDQLKTIAAEQLRLKS